MAETFVFGLAGADDINKGYGTFTTDLPDGSEDNVIEKLNLSHFMTSVTVAFSATPVFDLQDGIVNQITLTADVTSSTIVNGSDDIPDGALIYLRIAQDSGGGWDFVFPNDVAGGPALATMVSKTADAVTIVALVYSVLGAEWMVLCAMTSGVPARQYVGGRSLTSGDFALSGGWGTTASISSVSGTDQRGRFTVTSAGTGQGASPTITITFKDGAWPAAPYAVVTRNGGSQASVLPTWTITTTALVITFPGTPVAAQTFTYEYILMG